ncbi:MAG: hypothetical protein HY863_14145 [Chloroflexi bacterium]|nr:hypothetical protein [Chloroflexota bacterium]
MGKKVIFNGIEILTTEDDVSARSFFDFTEEVIDLLEENLDGNDENFHLSINTEFFMNKPPKHSISVNGLKNQGTREKVMKVLQRAAGILHGHASGTAKVNLLVEDR